MTFRSFKFFLGFWGIICSCNFSSNGQMILKGATDLNDLRFWLGLKSGVNFSNVKILERHQVLSATSEEKEAENEKKYSKTTSNLGQTVGVIFGFAFTPNILLTFQPAYSNYKFGYTTTYAWANAEGEGYVLHTHQNNRIGYIDLPFTLLLRKQIGRVEPYIHAGWYWGLFMGGRKKIKYDERLIVDGALLDRPQQTEMVGLGTQLMKSQMGGLAGIGVAYTIQYFRIGLEATYKQGLYNLTDTKKRYVDTRAISKFFEVPDDFKLNQWEITLNFFMPVDNIIHLHSSQKSRGGRRK